MFKTYNWFSNTGKNTALLKCPQIDCVSIIDEEDIRKITKNNKEKIEIISDIKAQEWLIKQPNAKHCPTPDCTYVFLNENQSPETIRCPNCKLEYCSNCLYSHPMQILCKDAENNRNIDKENNEWIVKNTKKCPFCGTNIEKNGGCDFVTCTNCKNGFCFNCFGSHHVLDVPFPCRYKKSRTRN